jgi:ribosomal protein S18 acetylase RimI-like enzyme
VTAITIRHATRADAMDLVAFVDMAGEGFSSYLWGTMTEAGQSPIEIGRQRAQRNTGSFSWRNAHIAEVDATVAGALIGYVIDDPVDPADIMKAPGLARPLAELEADAPGYWYVNVLAVHPEFRRHGVGAALLVHADALGREAGTKGMAIIVASENDRAVRLYARAGYRQAARRPIRPFPGYRRSGDWVLLTKPHS